MEEVALKTESKTSKVLKLLLKVAVTAICFWYISKKIDFAEARDSLLKADWAFMLLALLLLMLSKIVASFRLNIYFRNINIYLSAWKNIKLYFLGMFYNLFLPGAISGDAYKVILLKRKYDVPYKKTSAAVLMDRFSGLLGIGLILATYGIIALDNALYNAILITGSITAVAIVYLIVRIYFKDFLPGFWQAFLWGIVVQVIQVTCVYCILNALDLSLDQPQWIFIFLVSSVVSVIPVSLGGGLGTREFIFVTGAEYFKLDPDIGVIISLLFYFSNVLSSIWGVYFVFHNPLHEKNKEEINVAI